MGSVGKPSSTAPLRLVVRVKRELVAACVTCPLCRKLLRDATTISECLHTFCRKCIFEKLVDEEVDCCPICNTDLGCLPVEKLRSDHNLQDVRAKIFPYKRRKVEAPAVVSSISFTVKKKERSLSSLVVNTPRIGSQLGMTGRRTKVSRRAAALNQFNPVIGAAIKKQNDNVLQCEENSSSTENLNKMATYRRRQGSLIGEASNHVSKGSKGNSGESFLDNSDLWKPLSCLVEVANSTKTLESSSQGPDVKAELISGSEVVVYSHKTDATEHLQASEIKDNKNDSISLTPEVVQPKRLPGTIRKRKNDGSSAQALVDATPERDEWQNGPVWFSLLASADQEGNALLPQIPSCYLRIKDGTLPVSFVQKYLVKKLNLASEAEVEITCCGQPVSPTMSLRSLMDLWLRAESPQHRVAMTVGKSAEEFMMILYYSRKV